MTERLRTLDMDYLIQHEGNCCVWDLRGILNEGTVINKTMIEKPHGFLTACTIATQCDLVVASSQYGLTILFAVMLQTL